MTKAEVDLAILRLETKACENINEQIFRNLHKYFVFDEIMILAPYLVTFSIERLRTTTNANITYISQKDSEGICIRAHARLNHKYAFNKLFQSLNLSSGASETTSKNS